MRQLVILLLSRYRGIVVYKELSKLGLLVLVLIVLLWQGTRGLTKIRTLRSELDENKSAYQKLREKGEAISQALRLYPNYSQLLGVAREVLPSKPEELRFLNSVSREVAEVEATALYSGTPSKTPKEAKEEKEKVVKSFPFVLGGQGEYLKIKDLVEKLEGGLRIVQIKSLNIHKEESGKPIQFSLEGKVFWHEETSRGETEKFASQLPVKELELLLKRRPLD